MSVTHSKHRFFKIEKSYFLTISVGMHVLIVALFGGTILFKKYIEQPNFVSEGAFETTVVAEQAPPQNAAPTMPTLAPSMPTVPTMSAITTVNPTAQAFTLPVTNIAAPNMSNTMAQQMTAAAAGSIQKSLTGLPASMGNRSGSRRMMAMQQAGAKPASETAVLNALRWLQKAQNPDGTWGKQFKGAMTGFALLCFLGHGETPSVSQEFGVTVSNGINALVAEGSRAQGRFTFQAGASFNNITVYEQGIATYAACESYTMTKDERLAPIIAQAVDYILKGQGADGGWMYGYSKLTPSDTSVSGWQIQALKAARLTGLPIDGIPAALDNAMKNLDRVYDVKNGSFGYRIPGDHIFGLTGVGVLCKLQYQEKADNMVREGLKNILETTTVKYDNKKASLYAWYYDTQACFMAGGGTWQKWNKMFQDEIISSQAPEGSWQVSDGSDAYNLDQNETIDGQLYRTCLCTLMLEVYYRFLPTGKSGGGAAM